MPSAEFYTFTQITQMKSYILFGLAILGLVACDKNEGESDKPKASFSAAGYEVSVPCDVTFVNNSSNATSYLWTFGDGTSSTSPNPVKRYTAIGSYFVKLKVTGPKGTDSVCKLLALDQVVNPSQSYFSYFMDRCEGTPVNVYFRSLNPQSQFPAWDFGEGTTGNDASVIVRYGSPGNYTIKFSTQINGVRDTIIRAISIN